MSFDGPNYLAVLVAAVASFVFGGVWYGVFAKQWMLAANKSEEDVAGSPKIAGVQWQLPVTFLALLFMAFMLSGIIGHLGAGQVTLLNGLISGFFIWLGFVIPTMYVNHAYQGQPLCLTTIDGGHWLGVLLVQGAVIGMLGV